MKIQNRNQTRRIYNVKNSNAVKLVDAASDFKDPSEVKAGHLLLRREEKLIEEEVANYMSKKLKTHREKKPDRPFKPTGKKQHKGFIDGLVAQLDYRDRQASKTMTDKYGPERTIEKMIEDAIYTQIKQWAKLYNISSRLKELRLCIDSNLKNELNEEEKESDK